MALGDVYAGIAISAVPVRGKNVSGSQLGYNRRESPGMGAARPPE